MGLTLRRKSLWAGLLAFLLLPASFASARDFVVPVTISNLISNPANLFDLQGKTVRFTPTKDGSYQIETLDNCDVVECHQLLKGNSEGKGWSVSLPFAFPFAGNTWQRVYVNLNGNISFDKPESDYLPARNPFADGGMCSVAAAIDSRSAAGFEKMIAAFWGPYQRQRSNKVSIDIQPDCLAVTWQVTRANWGQAVLGVNTFQARLHASGVIESSYPNVAERDGIVGLFPGQVAVGTNLLSHWHYDGTAPDPAVDVDSADVYDAGTVLDLAFTMKHNAATNVDSGPLDYRCWVNHDGLWDMVSVSVSDRQQMSCWLGSAPLTGGWQIKGRRVDMFVSKVLLATCKQCSVAWDVTWWGKPARGVGSGDNLPPFALSNAAPTHLKLAHPDHANHSGNVFEVFHYPVVTKASERLLASIYQKTPAPDDIGLVFTDFRIDDVYGQGNGALAVNVPIAGIGAGRDKPRSTAEIGSTNLQINIATVWVGVPLFNESGTKEGFHWTNFASAVSWIGHECTHRWGMGLSFINPVTGKEEPLVDEHGHWREGLNTTTMFSTSETYLNEQRPGASMMGGYSWRTNENGTFSRNKYPYGVPAGYSALDLYAMGLLPADKVPPTFLLENLKRRRANRFQAQSVPVRIEDIVKAMGERQPASAEAQKEFHMTLYLAHEEGREVDPAMLARAQKLSVALTNYFSKATGGVMKVLPTEPAPPASKPAPRRGRRGRRRQSNTTSPYSPPPNATRMDETLPTNNLEDAE